MFQLDVRSTVAALARLRQRLQAEQPELLRTIGRRVLARAHEAFNVKAAGGTGSDGIRWRPLSARYVRQRKVGSVIGVRSGELRDPRGDLLDVDRDSVRVGFADPHAEFFDEVRPLLPDRLPDAWYREANQFLQARLDAAAEGVSP